VPEQVVRALDGSAHAFEEVFSLEEPADEGDAGSSAVRGPATLAIRSESFADLGATVAEFFGVEPGAGRSFLGALW